MADAKISALTALTAANTATDDEVVIVDTSALETKKQTVSELRTMVHTNLPLGSASTTTISPTGSTNSGFFWASATNLSIAISGAERFRFGSGGSIYTFDGISIGTSAAAPDVFLKRGAASLLTVRGSASAAAAISLGVLTVATLPAAATAVGGFASVSDANATTRLSAVAGGGANFVMVVSNGTNWLIV